MATITYEEVLRHTPEVLMPVNGEFEDAYREIVSSGRGAAASKRVAFVAICRNAMPFLPRTLGLVARTGEMFADWKCFIYENDSADDTKSALESASRQDSRFEVRLTNHGRPHLNFTKTSDRTIPLAEYRNACRDWCRENASDFDYCVVFDTDPWGGWSIDGVASTIGYLDSGEYAAAAGMGSYSWCEWGPPVWPWVAECQYDGWAFRLNHWNEQESMAWFHFWKPPVGSPPVRANSCFGQLAVYRMGNYLAGQYRGGDCEHVHHWRTCGGDCYLNPSQRVVSFWIPDEEKRRDGLHADLHTDVAVRDADPDHRRDAEDIG
jgi:hypothetical protein